MAGTIPIVDLVWTRSGPPARERAVRQNSFELQRSWMAPILNERRRSMRSTLQRLTRIRGVLAAAVFNKEGNAVAFYGQNPALDATSTCGEMMTSLARIAGRPNVPRIGELEDARILAQPIDAGFLIVVTEPDIDTDDRHVWFALGAAGRDLDRALRFPAISRVPRDESPSSETFPCLMRPPGY